MFKFFSVGDCIHLFYNSCVIHTLTCLPELRENTGILAVLFIFMLCLCSSCGITFHYSGPLTYWKINSFCWSKAVCLRFISCLTGQAALVGGESRASGRQKWPGEQRPVHAVCNPSDRLHQHCSSEPKNSAEGWVSLAATTHSKRKKCVCFGKDRMQKEKEERENNPKFLLKRDC